MIKKIALMTLIAGFAAQGYAAQTAVCTTTTAAAGAKVTVAKAATPLFIKTDFPMVCSSNVLLDYDENAVVAAVGAVSLKGKSSFLAHTDGGSPKKSADCPASGCTATEVTNALTAAKTAASF